MTNDEITTIEDDEFFSMLNDDEFLEHIGIARRSGRYPWGSGDDAYQRSRSFKAYMDEMKKKGLTESEIAKGLTDYANRGVKEPKDMITIKTTDLRAGTAISTEQIFAANQARAHQLAAKNMSNGAIAEAMGLPRSAESTVRGWLKHGQEVKEGSLRAIANVLKDQVEKKEYLDVGKGNELWLGVAESKLRSAVAMLKDEGYNLYNMSVAQLGMDKETKMRVLTKEDKTFKDAITAKIEGRVGILAPQSDDNGTTFRTPASMPVPLNSKRMEVRYKEDGGEKMDGVIELRRGVNDLDLGAGRYAQIRMAVDGTHYLKGMAMYADDLPAGIDVRFNTNKTKVEAPGKLDSLKPLKIDKATGEVDPANPFGATTKPHMYKDKKGNEKTSPLNMVNEEGKWDDWSKSLSSQMLSKQPLKLAAAQLALTQKTQKEDLDAIMALTNPVVRQKMLDEYADSADAAAVHLKAAALPRQASRVLLPINAMRPNEVYAPEFENGTKVALVRYPHGGPFEIPTLTVNNKNLTAKRILGTNPRDAIGIHHSVAAQLSGADFDGDSVLLIDNTLGQVKARPPLKDLENFEPKAAYPSYKGMKEMTKKNTQTEMGKISNLITDMTIKGANDAELARAVKHSMVVIDAEKHKLNYKQSEIDNGIAQLKTDYQGGARRGASTLISRASSTQRIDKIVPRPAGKDEAGNKIGPIDPKTGRKVFVPAPDREYTVPKKDKAGNVKVDADGNPILITKTKQTKGTQMEFATDARKLSSGTPMEELYAAHANTMKELANSARKASIALTIKGLPKQNKAAKVVYANEVAALENKLKIAQRNAPLERRAQTVGNAMAKARIDANPQFDSDDIKKVQYQSLAQAREITGASKVKIGAKDEQGNSTLTSREWEAIQAGAFSSSRLKEILANADMDRVKSLATPKSTSSLSTGQQARAKAMAASGKPMSEIAEALGIPRSTLVDNLNRD